VTLICHDHSGLWRDDRGVRATRDRPTNRDGDTIATIMSPELDMIVALWNAEHPLSSRRTPGA
jgi:hypothetical protein